MMQDEAPHDVEAHFDEDVNIPSFVKRESWNKRIAIALGVIVAIVLIIILPIAMANAENGSSTPAAIGVGSDGNSVGQQPTVDVTTEDPLDSVPSDNEQPTLSDKEETDSEEPNQSSIPEAITVPPAFTNTICSMLNISQSDTSNWLQIADQIMGEALQDLSGTALDMSADGSIVAIASGGNDGNGRNSGHIRVYRYASLGEFSPMGQELNGEAAGDMFGASVALDASGYRLAAGGLYNDGKTGENSGHVRVYDYSEQSDTWHQVGDDIEGPFYNSQLGRSLSMSADGKRLAVGASNCTANNTEMGCIYLYDLVENTWVLYSQIRGENEGDGFGESVDLSGDGTHVAIGAHKHDTPNGGTEVGQVAIYKNDAIPSSWEKVGNDIGGIFPGDWAGMTVSLSFNGSRVAVGFPGDNEGIPVPGFSRVYELNNGVWAQLGSSDLTGGFSVSLSRDGNRVAVGDYNGMRSGVLSGHVYIYEFSTASQEWEVLGQEINGLPYEMSGLRVGLSSDGKRVTIAAPLASSHNGTQEVGAVRLYDLC
jgi:FG-GAP repeat